MKRFDTVAEYIDFHKEWNVLLNALRTTLNDTELNECVKWGAPVYTIEGKNVIGLSAFKNHLALWFFNGVFLEDKEQKLINAQEGKTKSLRQWRFKQGDAIDEVLVKKYVMEAIANQKMGKVVKPERNKEFNIPNLLQTEFDKNAELYNAFNGLTPGKRKEYANYIAEAKREATKLTRIQKCIPLILAGSGLHDKYKK